MIFDTHTHHPTPTSQWKLSNPYQPMEIVSNVSNWRRLDFFQLWMDAWRVKVMQIDCEAKLGKESHPWKACYPVMFSLIISNNLRPTDRIMSRKGWIFVVMDGWVVLCPDRCKKQPKRKEGRSPSKPWLLLRVYAFFVLFCFVLFTSLFSWLRAWRRETQDPLLCRSTYQVIITSSICMHFCL